MNNQTTNLTQERCNIVTTKDEKPTHLDLFSGIGGFALAAQWAGFQTIGFCEIEPYCQAVLKKHWPQVPIHSDIRELRGGGGQRIDLLTGGFPCQPFSVAGKRRGKDDDRHIWPEMLRIVEESKPSWIVGENVAGIIAMELDKVCVDLEAAGYEVQPLVIPACGVDAPHRRDRVWIVANAKGRKRGGLCNESETQGSRSSDELSGNSGGLCRELIADNSTIGTQGQRPSWVKKPSTYECKKLSLCEGQGCEKSEWDAEPKLGRVANGIRNRTHRIKGLGNAIVPQVAFQILKNIKQIMDENGED